MGKCAVNAQWQSGGISAFELRLLCTLSIPILGLWTPALLRTLLLSKAQ